jgi:hypothetical protein
VKDLVREEPIAIRITKAIPAPEMDGFDLRGLQLGRTYYVEVRVAQYLVFSGYAESLP